MLTANDIEHLIAVLDITRKKCRDGEFETLEKEHMRYSRCEQLHSKLIHMKEAEEDWEKYFQAAFLNS